MKRVTEENKEEDEGKEGGKDNEEEKTKIRIWKKESRRINLMRTEGRREREKREREHIGEL